MPELPAFGMRFVMPTKADGFVYEGLSGETYPDRKAGGIHGIYEVEGLPVTPYLVPQECGMHMDTESIIPRLHFHVFLILQKNLRMQRIRKSCRRKEERYFVSMERSVV